MDKETLISFEPEQTRKKLNIGDSIFRAGLGRTLFINLFFLSVIPLSILAIVSYQHILSINQQNQYQQLNTIIASQKKTLSTYIDKLSEQLQSLGELENTQYFLRDLSSSYKTSTQSLASFVKSEQWQHINQLYNIDNDQILNNNDIINLYLIDMNGNILYSNAKSEDLGLNINTKKLATSHFSKTINRNLETGRMQFSDIGFYKYFDAKPAAFISQTVVDKRGALLGSVVAQIALQPIDLAMRTQPQPEKSTQHYLLGLDGFLRNNMGENDLTLLTLKLQNRATNNWLHHSGQSHRSASIDQLFSNTYNGIGQNSVFGTYQSLTIGGVKWGLFAEISQQNALQSVFEFRNMIALIFGLSIVVIFSAALFVSHQIVNPLKCIVEWAKNIGRGKLDMTYIVTHEKEINQLNNAIIDIVKYQQQSCELVRSISRDSMLTDSTLRNEVNILIDQFDDMCKRLASIAQGEYGKIIEELNDSKSANSKFNHISLDVAHSFSDSELHRWLAQGKYNLLQCILKQEQEESLLEAHEQSLQKFAEEFIAEISQYLEANVGLLYLTDDEHTLILTGKYAYSEHPNLSEQFRIGEGIVGQVALQTQAVRISAIPDGHINIRTGSGDIKPETIIVSPFFYNNHIAGVIELAFTGKPKNKTELYLQNISGQAGLMFHDAELFDRLIVLSSQAVNQNDILATENVNLKTHNDAISERLLTQKQELLARHGGDSDLGIHTENQGIVDSQLKTSIDYIDNISSGLRAPLKRMLVLSQALTQNTSHNLDKAQLESAQVIHQCGKELLNLTDDIYKLTQFENDRSLLKNSSIDISQLCDSLRHEFIDSTQQKFITLLIHINDSAPKTIIGDQNIIKNIIRHLLMDAIKFTSSGSINITVDKYELDQNTNAENFNFNMIKFSISDTGMSIPNDDSNSLFDNKDTDKESIYRDSRGASLGLNISKRLSRLVNGDIQYFSKHNGGCRFDVLIPIESVQSTPANIFSIEAEVNTSQLANVTKATPIKNVSNEQNTGIILVIDDDKTRNNHLQKILSASSFQCFVTDSGENLQTLAKLHNPTAIILNPDMSNVDGSLVFNMLMSSMYLKSVVTYLYSHDGKLARPEKSVNDNAIEIASELDRLFHNVIFTSDENIKHVLVVEKSQSEQLSITNSLKDELTEITLAETATAAYNFLQEKVYDCVILELELPDLGGDKLLEQVALSEDIALPPVIVYTNKDLNEKEHRRVSRYSDAIIRKGINAHHRLKKEVNVYLHTSESNLPPAMRQRVEMIHSEQQIMNDKSALLVDDDFLLTYPLSTALKQCGMAVVVANNGEHCLDLLKNNGPFDIVIMDVLLPIMNGVDAIKKIRSISLHADLPIIALTSKATQEDRIACLAAGASDYIVKPIDITALLSVMQIWLSSNAQKNINSAA